MASSRGTRRRQTNNYTSLRRNNIATALELVVGHTNNYTEQAGRVDELWDNGHHARCESWAGRACPRAAGDRPHLG